MINRKIDAVFVDLRQRRAVQSLVARRALDLPDGLEVLIHLPLVFDAQTGVKALAVVHDQVEDRRVALQARADLIDTFIAVGVEQAVEDLIWLMHRRIALPRPRWLIVLVRRYEPVPPSVPMTSEECRVSLP